MSLPERSAAPRDDRTGWEREGAGDGTPQLCRGIFGQRTPCTDMPTPGTTHCPSCHDYIGGMGTGGT